MAAVALADHLPVRQRELNRAEQRLLRARAKGMRSVGGRAVRRGVWAGIAAILALWLWTMLASDSPAFVITIFWLLVGGAIVTAVHRSLTKDQQQLDSLAADLESALRRNLADVYDIQAARYIAFEEIEDEGACYAFELADSRILFLQGQEFYEAAGFPSLDFSLVMPLDERGRRVHQFIDKRGPKAAPERVVPAKVKARLRLPDDLELIEGPLTNIEERLRCR